MLNFVIILINYGIVVVKVKAIAKNEDGTVNWRESMFALQARGKGGPGAGFGFARFGSYRFGNSNEIGGIYQKRVTGYNQYGRSPGRPRKAYYVKMRSYRPSNPRTPIQQAHRAKMAEAVIGWRELDPVEKSRYNQDGKRRNKVGRNLYISWYLKNH